MKKFENKIEIPEQGSGLLEPLWSVEKGFNWLVSSLPLISALLLAVIAIFITVDVIGRLIFNTPWIGITDLETLFMSAVGFLTLAFAVASRSSMQIDLLYNTLGAATQRVLYLFANGVSMVVSFILGYMATKVGWNWGGETGVLNIPEWPSVTLTGICLLLTAIAFMFQLIHCTKAMFQRKEYLNIFIGLASTTFIFCIPFIYKYFEVNLSGLAIGSIGFLLLMVMLLLRVPLGWGMAVLGVIGLLIIMRRPSGAFNAISTVPFSNTTTFILIAFPMFMLMGEMVTAAGLSEDLFNAAQKWFGRLPGGLACAAVGGCAGFGAVCGDSTATLLTMSTVAMPAMEKNHYDKSFSCGALAAGGTLGILIPPSMGFIFYSMITEESVGKLFLAGIIPGILLTLLFMLVIIIRVKRNPALAPPAEAFSLKEKLQSLLRLVPVIALFLLVVMGILSGWFTPAEGGAVGAMVGMFIALARRRMNFKLFIEIMTSSTRLFGKMFALFIGMYVLQAFLTGTRMPEMLATFVVGIEANRYVVLAAVILLYMILGCIMNIGPMMMLTLPSIYPAVMALGFDSVWFGVICVIIMEMGMITPPVGMNVFILSGLYPEMGTAGIFKGVAPFFFAMLVCVALVVCFPQLALFLL